MSKIGYVPLGSTADEWVKHGKASKLIGTFPVTTIFKNELAVAEVHWINDPKLIGLRYPDNSRMAVSAGWLQHRDEAINRAYHALLKEYNKLAGIKPKLRLQHRVQYAPGTLRLKERPGRQSGRALSAPPSNEGHASGVAAPGHQLKLKSRRKFKRRL